MLIKLNTTNGEVWINPNLVKSVSRSSTDDGKTVVVFDDDFYYIVEESIYYVIDEINNELGRGK